MIVRAKIYSVLLRAFFVIHTFIIIYQINLLNGPECQEFWSVMYLVSTFVVLLQVLFV